MLHINPNPNKQIKNFKMLIKHCEKQISQLKEENYISKKNIVEECINKYCEKAGSQYIIDEDMNLFKIKYGIILSEKSIYRNEKTGLDINFVFRDNLLIISTGTNLHYKHWEKKFEVYKIIDITTVDDEYVRNKTNKILRKIESHMLSRIQRKEYKECEWRINND